MQLSYAQNLEDYHLSLLFAGQETGTYVDVGGGHPVADNVSFWFYLRGWRGLVVEPQRALADLYAAIRPRDSTACCVVGRADGQTDFHVVERLHGFSTTVESHAATARSFGAGYATVSSPMRTLASLSAEHRLGPIDFLKVDVEGAEADVLAGNDWRQWRPRVVLVEAVEPGSMAEAWSAWEPMLLEHGYRFGFFDGLNRFYVADEAAGLMHRLPREKTPWDRVRHLYEFGRAADNAAHPDHRLARALIDGFLAALPTLAPTQLADLIARSSVGRAAQAGAPTDFAALLSGAAEYPGREPSSDEGTLEQRLGSDRIRAALGRIAAAYDGGQLLD